MLVKYYIPSKDSEGNPLDSELSDKYKNEVIAYNSRVNGGCTEYQATGYYLAENGTLIAEPITVIDSFGASILPKSKIAHYRKILNQESMMYSIDDKAYFITE